MANKIDPGGMSAEELAAQLRRPEGEAGRFIGMQMNKGNKNICLSTYAELNPSNGDHILEIGMGNGYFVKELLALAEDLNYVGADFSKVMVEEANALNRDLVENRSVKFVQASIESLPFDDQTFNCITTTNTLYFWPNPPDNAKELWRVLKPGGKILIAYRPKNILDGIEATKFGFEKYEPDQCENLLRNAGFTEISSDIIPEEAMDFDGVTIQMSGCYTFGYKKLRSTR